MRLTYLLPVFFFLIFNINFSQEWVKTEITEFASIKFPFQSELTKTQSEIVFVSEDENAYYLVNIKELGDEQSSRISKLDLTNFYKSIAKGAIASTNGKLIEMNKIEIQGIPAVELEYEAISSNNLPNKRFKRIIYYNQTIFSIDFWPLTGQKDIIDKNKSKFFESFSVNLNKIENTLKNNISSNDQADDNNANLAYKTGFIVGQIIFYILLIGIFVGIIFFIKKLVKRSGINKNVLKSEIQNDIESSTIICRNCETENTNNSKYCKRCGYELKS